MVAEMYAYQGKEYRLVDRKATVGEKILTVTYSEDETGIEPGDILTCSKAEYDDGSIEIEEIAHGFFDISIGDNYRVLEPVDDVGPTVDATQATPQVVDMLANLARRVTSLESQLRDTQNNVEKLAEELATETRELDEKVEMALDDIVSLDERTSGVLSKAPSSAQLLADAFRMLAQYEGSAR